MARWRAGLGLVAGVMLVLSSAAHSVLGWKAIGGELAAAGVPADLTFGLKAGWQFGGASMLAFGIICISMFAMRLRRRSVPSFPAFVIGGVYLVFGAWALAASQFDPFFLIFIVPAILLVAASTGGSA